MTSRYTPREIEAFVSRFYGNQATITPYGYTANFVALAQNQTQTVQVNIQATGDFILLSVHHRSRLAAAGQTVTNKPAPICRLLLIDTGSNEQLTAQPVDLESYGTNDAKLNELHYPRIIPGRSSLTAQLTNYAPAAESVNCEVFLNGVLVRGFS